MTKLNEIFIDCDMPDNIMELNNWTGKTQWNAIYTIQLGELIECGVFSWETDLLNWSNAAFDNVQYARVCDYFIERYRFREISIEPYYEWATMVKRKLVYELMPKYRPLYERVAEGINPFVNEDEYYKRRTIGSDYPETLLSGNADYISDGEDEEYERLKEGNAAENENKFAELYKGVDELVLDGLESCFISLYTMNLNAL